MYRLSSIVILSICCYNLVAQNPHGESFKVDCAVCHDPSGWEIAIDTFSFDHDTTSFPLEGVHLEIDCKSCHTELVFKGTSTECIDCHLDVHQMSVGNQCARCHDSNSWLVFNTQDIHEQNGFPLVGGHQEVNCIDCHISETNLRFEPLGNDCINCHLDDFRNTTDPDHEARDFSLNCTECHDVFGFDWSSENINHDFFPLILGHDIQDCKACHLTEDFSQTSPECISCHQEDFEMATNPNHVILDFSVDCASCHTLDPGWKPAEFLEHDALYFPIYSGAHQGEWDQCADCHLDPNDYSLFSCTVCHERNDTDDDHDGVQGYVYESNACLACHPNGSEDDNFDHSKTDFPLTGAHIGLDCLECHSEGFAGTPIDCAACHTEDFNQSVNPDHNSLGLSMDCASCHTTDPDWMPASFDIHDQFYPLNGAHALIANDCVSCHNGDYNNTPNTCIACHQEDYDETSDPNHAAAMFPTDCLECHTEDSWEPSTFDHDNQYFPIYSGSHQGEWSECIDCHIDPNDYSVFSCIVCHTNPDTDDEHDGIPGYIYEDNACLACHPTGESDMAFNHDETNFPLTGAHIGLECMNCHSEGFEGTPTDCASCHTEDFNQTINPDHNGLGLSMDCLACHTTDPAWMPASFDIHDQFFALNGAHAMIANDCATCHNGDYNNTPNTCIGCHQADFENTTDPNHEVAMFPTDCLECHTEDNWEPSTFDHDGQYFPIYSGAHQGEWTECIDCHINPNDFSVFSCVVCHLNPETDDEHDGVSGYIYEDNACLACHPTGESDMAFNHDETNFPLTGAHIGLDCMNCHSEGFEGTPTDCASCHTEDFNQTINPDHNGLGLSMDCLACHTTDPAWMPASFDIHDQFFALNGAHATIANDCVTCHNGDYNNTPNTCIGCHQSDFDNTTDPNHEVAMFPTDCLECHTEDSWEPSTFDHDGQYFPIYSGAHQGEWSECVDCHIDPNDFSIFSCVVCHTNPETDDEHNGVAGYIFEDNACLACHPTGNAEMAFNHDETDFPLTGSHIGLDCLDCHADGFEGTSTDCASCHTEDFNQAVNPDHNDLGLSMDCASCHTTDPEWVPASFDVHDQFHTLNGAHAIIANDCITCHNGDYNNTPNTCIGCHQSDFETPTNPDHNDAGFSTDCLECHTEDAWLPAEFDHSFYAINGAHESLDCNSCHALGYDNTPNTCIGCHQSDYDNTTNPNHAAAMFPTDCLSCHNESDWAEVSWDHDAMYFPIYSGKHQGEWNQCIECHLDPNDFSSFSCIDCHEHNDQNQVDEDHEGVGGYVYESNACFECHPNGEE